MIAYQGSGIHIHVRWWCWLLHQRRWKVDRVIRMIENTPELVTTFECPPCQKYATLIRILEPTAS